MFCLGQSRRKRTEHRYWLDSAALCCIPGARSSHHETTGVQTQLVHPGFPRKVRPTEGIGLNVGLIPRFDIQMALCIFNP